MLNHDHEFDCIGSIDPEALAQQEERLLVFLQAKDTLRRMTESGTQQWGSRDERPKQMS